VRTQGRVLWKKGKMALGQGLRRAWVLKPKHWTYGLPDHSRPGNLGQLLQLEAGKITGKKLVNTCCRRVHGTQ
jgi:hypothetical protein